MIRAPGESMVKAHVRLYEKELTCENLVGTTNLYAYFISSVVTYKYKCTNMYTI